MAITVLPTAKPMAPTVAAISALVTAPAAA